MEAATVYQRFDLFHRLREITNRLRNFHQRQPFFCQRKAELRRTPRVEANFFQALASYPQLQLFLNLSMVDYIPVGKDQLVHPGPLTIELCHLA